LPVRVPKPALFKLKCQEDKLVKKINLKIVTDEDTAALLDQEYTITKIIILTRIYSAINMHKNINTPFYDEPIFSSSRINALFHEVLFKMITPGISPDPSEDILPLIKNELLSFRNTLKHPELIKIADTKIKSLDL